MGLKQMIDKAMQGDEAAIAALPPVEVSGDAHRVYSELVRKWTGWHNGVLKFEEPEVSPFAACNRKARVVIANPERLLLNPNRVLIKVNPFRLRQEAVLTGALLHEAAHVRHSDWLPRTEIEVEAFKHSDGSDVTKPEMALAKVAEEARIEGLVSAEADKIGAAGLAWTMRACAAHVVPMTELAADPEQALMDLISSWLLRAGRQMSLQYHINHSPAPWVGEFTLLLHRTLVDHIVDQSNPNFIANRVLELLVQMCRGTVQGANSMFEADVVWESDSGPFMVDHAKEILTLLFPETPPEQMPMASSGCGAGEGGEGGEGVSDLPGEADEAGTGEGNSDPEDEGAGDEPGEGTAGGDGDEEGEEGAPAFDHELAQALKDIEGKVKTESTEQAKTEAKATDQTGGLAGGMGSGSAIGGGWRRPSIPEREVKVNAERFLRDMIEPNVASKIRITDQPSSMIDGAALAAWKAGGQVKAPRFFQQVKRTIKPMPPVKIAVLVDVSASMDVMQKPSALLSWALAAACLDLRNYAGGGVMIESTLIHWGSTARVIQRNGEVLPGIREVGCNDGTVAMHQAYELIDQEIPGFFDAKDQPENKLIVHFTDWQLNGNSEAPATEWVGRGLEAGASMLSVVPQNFTSRYNSLPRILAAAKIQRGRNHLMRYDPNKPEAVWTTAAKALGQGR